MLGDNDGRVALLDPESLGLRFLDDVDGPVAAGAITTDGETVGVVLLDAGVQLLDVESGERLGVPMPGRSYDVSRVEPGARWNDAGTHVWTSTRGPVHRYIATPDAWLERACEIAGRELTEEEWRQYIGDSDPQTTCTP